MKQQIKSWFQSFWRRSTPEREDNGRWLLIETAEQGQIDKVESLLGEGIHVDVRGGREQTALHIAAETDNLRLAEILLHHQADANARNDVGQTPLFFAQSGIMATALLNRGAAVYFRDQWNDAAVHEAAQKGYIDVVKQIEAAGGSIMCCGSQGKTPLHFAAQEGAVAVIDYLLAKGVDLNAPSELGTPLHACHDVQTQRILVEKGADLNARDPKGYTPLHTRAFFGEIESMRHLLEEGASVHTRDNDGATPLHLTCRPAMVELLLGHGADVNAMDSQGMRPLHTQAARYEMWPPGDQENIAMMELLIKHGAEIEALDKSGRTALSIAAQKGDLLGVKALVSHGASVHGPLGHAWPVGFTPNPEVVVFLTKHGASVATDISMPKWTESMLALAERDTAWMIEFDTANVRVWDDLKSRLSPDANTNRCSLSLPVFGRLVVGSSSHAEICLPNSMVGNRHADLVCNGFELRLEAHYVGRSIFLNHEFVSDGEKPKLRDGDEIRLGERVVVVRCKAKDLLPA